MLDHWHWFIIALLTPVAIWVFVRLVAAAWFSAKREYTRTMLRDVDKYEDRQKGDR